MSCTSTRRVTALVGLLLAGCTLQRPGQIDESAKQQLHGIAESLRSNKIELIETFHVPISAETPGDVTPDVLQQRWYYKTTIRNISASSRVALAAVLSTAIVQREAQMPDLRQGIVFYSNDHTAPTAIYFDRTGRYGALNNIPLSFQRDLLPRLKALLPLALE